MENGGLLGHLVTALGAARIGAALALSLRQPLILGYILARAWPSARSRRVSSATRTRLPRWPSSEWCRHAQLALAWSSVLAKGWVMTLLARVLGASMRLSVLIGAGLAQSAEFSF